MPERTCEPAHEVLVGAGKEVHGEVRGQAVRDGLQECRLQRGGRRLLRDRLPDVHEVRLRQAVHAAVLPLALLHTFTRLCHLEFFDATDATMMSNFDF